MEWERQLRNKLGPRIHSWGRTFMPTKLSTCDGVKLSHSQTIPELTQQGIFLNLSPDLIKLPGESTAVSHESGQVFLKVKLKIQCKVKMKQNDMKLQSLFLAEEIVKTWNCDLQNGREPWQIVCLLTVNDKHKRLWKFRSHKNNKLRMGQGSKQQCKQDIEMGSAPGKAFSTTNI